MKMACHTDEGFLNQILSPVTISGLPRYEMDKTVSVSFVQGIESFTPTVEVCRHEFLITELPERPLRKVSKGLFV